MKGGTVNFFTPSHKIRVPLSQKELVQRDRLYEALNNGLSRKFTIISAPAGYGKTTLLSEWIQYINPKACWFSIDKADNDEKRFIVNLIRAMQQLVPEFGQELEKNIHVYNKNSYEYIAEQLLMNFCNIDQESIVVLDDYHLIENDYIDRTLIYLLKNLPQNIHLIIISRETPNIPLGRFRVNDSVSEIRIKDLRFTKEESLEYFNSIMQINLNEENTLELDNKTEGWIAGLKMAAISLKNENDADHFIKKFSGTNQYIIDYLVEEMLNVQSKDVQDFLIYTSIHDMISKSFCEKVLEDYNLPIESIFDYIDKSNLFIVQLDNEKNWYRYHNLLADILQKKLFYRFRLEKEKILSFHLKASEWYEAQGNIVEAIISAFAAKNFNRVIELIKGNWLDLIGKITSQMWIDWYNQIPQEIVQSKITINIIYASALIHNNEIETADSVKDKLKFLLFEDGVIEIESLKSNINKNDPIISEFFMLLSLMAQAKCNIIETRKWAKIGINQLDKSRYHLLSELTSLDGLSYWVDGALKEAENIFKSLISDFSKNNKELFAIRCHVFLCYVLLQQAKITETKNLITRVFKLTDMIPDLGFIRLAPLEYSLSSIYILKGDIPNAKKTLEKAILTGKSRTSHVWHQSILFNQALIYEMEGNYQKAYDIIKESNYLDTKGFLNHIKPLNIFGIRILLKLNELEKASEEMNKLNLDASTPVSFLQEYSYNTFAMLKIKKYKVNKSKALLNEIIEILDKLLESSENNNSILSIIETLILLAITYQFKSDERQAKHYLNRALLLAKDDEIIQLFMNFDKDVYPLLRDFNFKDIPSHFIAEILSKIDNKLGRAGNQKESSLLTSRETEILFLISKGLSNNEISNQLFISLSTVKGHINSIFSKLEVRRRTEAVEKARELNII